MHRPYLPVASAILGASLLVVGCSGGGLSQATPAAPNGLTNAALPATPSPFVPASPGSAASPAPSPSPTATAQIDVQ